MTPGPLHAVVDVEALAAAVAARLEPRNASAPLVDSDQAGELLGVPATWVRAEARADRIPHVRLGRYVRFDVAELEAWWASRRRGPWRTGCGPVSTAPVDPVAADDRAPAGRRDTGGATDVAA